MCDSFTGSSASIKKARVPSALKQKLQSKLNNLSLVRVQQGTPTPSSRKPRRQIFRSNTQTSATVGPTQSAINTATPPPAGRTREGAFYGGRCPGESIVWCYSTSITRPAWRYRSPPDLGILPIFCVLRQLGLLGLDPLPLLSLLAIVESMKH